jgi:hypothetical protein
METNTDGTAIETIRLSVEEMPCDHSEITAGKTLVPAGVVGYRTHAPSRLAKQE